MDEKAKNILLSAYWGSGGWKDGSTSPENFNHALKHKVMFQPTKKLTHADAVRNAIAARDKLTARKVGEGFAASLSTRMLNWRSAIGSFGNCRLLKPHRFKPHPEDMDYLCSICDAHRAPGNSDLNVLNFERLKWGGVRHDSLIYNWLDLRQFKIEFKETASRKDIALLKEMLKLIRMADPKMSTGALKRELKSLIPQTNNEECGTLLEILVYAGLISSDWRGKEGLNEELADRYFKKLLK